MKVQMTGCTPKPSASSPADPHPPDGLCKGKGPRIRMVWRIKKQGDLRLRGVGSKGTDDWKKGLRSSCCASELSYGPLRIQKWRLGHSLRVVASKGHYVDTYTWQASRWVVPSSLNQLGLNVTSSFCKTTWANILFRLRAAWRTCKF